MFTITQRLISPERCGNRPRRTTRKVQEPQGTDFKVANPLAAFGQAVGTRAIPPLSGTDNQRGITMKKRIDINTVPELATSVGMHGSIKQKEVGGPLCLGLFVAVVIAL